MCGWRIFRIVSLHLFMMKCEGENQNKLYYLLVPFIFLLTILSWPVNGLLLTNLSWPGPVTGLLLTNLSWPGLLLTILSWPGPGDRCSLVLDPDMLRNRGEDESNLGQIKMQSLGSKYFKVYEIICNNLYCFANSRHG